MMQEHKIKNIIFDLGGVLVGLDRLACVHAFEELGFSTISNYLGDYKQADLFHKLEIGAISPEIFYQRLLSLTTLPVTVQQISAAWSKFLLDIPKEKLRLLERLSGKYNLYLLSNTNPMHFKQMEQTYQLSDYFKKCYLSYEMGSAKPSIDIFSKMLTDASFTPSECLFVDDAPDNINTASSLGIACKLFRPNDDLSDCLVAYL